MSRETIKTVVCDGCDREMREWTDPDDGSFQSEVTKCGINEESYCERCWMMHTCKVHVPVLAVCPICVEDINLAGKQIFNVIYRNNEWVHIECKVEEASNER